MASYLYHLHGLHGVGDVFDAHLGLWIGSNRGLSSGYKVEAVESIEIILVPVGMGGRWWGYI